MGVPSSMARCGLTVLSWGYWLGIATRNQLFDWNIKKSDSANVPVMSVGNITTGGTGKTPFVSSLVQKLIAKNHQPGIISRGYRSLEDGQNDEYKLLKQLCPETPHVQNRKRIEAAKQLLKESSCDCLILDDAFQHRQIHRDFNIVLIDALNPWGYQNLLPRGLLREPLSSLKRADVVCITRADAVDAEKLQSIRQHVQRYVLEDCVYEIIFQPRGFINASGQKMDSLEISKQNLAYSFCAIGNPAGFRQSLQGALPNVDRDLLSEKQGHVFPDHHHYDQNDFQALHSYAQKCGASLFLTTQKDLVKIDRDQIEGIPVWALQIEANFVEDEDRFFKQLMPIFRAGLKKDIAERTHFT